jgi:putative oxidoreductase
MATSKLKTILQPHSQTAFASFALLLLRLVVGTAFILHGWGKIQNAFGWMGPDAPVPGIFQFLAALSEFGGGIALIIGLVTPIASLGIAFTMAVATLFHAGLKKDPFVATTGGSSYEIALVYLIISIVFIAVGAGKFSLDAKIFGERK